MTDDKDNIHSNTYSSSILLFFFSKQGDDIFKTSCNGLWKRVDWFMPTASSAELDPKADWMKSCVSKTYRRRPGAFSKGILRQTYYCPRLPLVWGEVLREGDFFLNYFHIF